VTEFHPIDWIEMAEIEEHPAVKKFARELNAGVVSLVLLAILDSSSEALYGYEIAKRLEVSAGGELPMKRGTLYPVLRSMEEKGLLVSKVEPSVSGPPRKYYSITDVGREVFVSWKQMWEKTLDFVGTALDGEVDSDDSLQAELAKRGADPALIQDALFDAQEYLKDEAVSDDGEIDEAGFARAVAEYGSPQEISDSYVGAELTVKKAMAVPKPQKGRSWLQRFFGVAADPRTYASMAYMLIAFGTGIVYFILAVLGVSLSFGLAILIIGIPFMLLFLSLVRGISFVEGRLVEALLGTRMPRRPRIVAPEGNLWERIKWWLSDRRTWTTLAYMVVQLPLGILYFVLLVVALALTTSMMVTPFVQVVSDVPFFYVGADAYMLTVWAIPVFFALGILLLFVFMHAIRGIGKAHGVYAKNMLVGVVDEGGPSNE